MFFFPSVRSRWGLVLACALLTVLWLPGLKYPVVSDTLVYVTLGKSIWHTGTYMLGGLPYAKHLPLHAIVSYPLVQFFGISFGMKLATLFGGFGVLTGMYALLRKSFGSLAALLAVFATVLHPAFALMTQLGSADLLFASLFLWSLYFFVTAQERPRSYVMAGLLLGLACLTRYNGLPVFALYGGYALWKRRADLRQPWFWTGMIIGIVIAGTWFVRSWLAFGSPLYSEYSGELAAEAPSLTEQILSNALYYGNPLHNIFPFLLPFALYGLWTHGRRQPLLALALPAIWLLTAVWWVQAMRFAMPGYPILIGFAIVGLMEAWKRSRLSAALFGSIAVAGFLFVHVPSLCLYTYGECNAWVDRHIGLIPPNLGLTPEGFYAWHVARNYVNEHAESGALFLADGADSADALRQSGIRKDLRIGLSAAEGCPSYRIAQRPQVQNGEEVVFTTEEEPRTAVIKQACLL